MIPKISFNTYEDLPMAALLRLIGDVPHNSAIEKKETTMELVKVESSMIQAVGYDAAAQELEVVFNTGKIYRYTGVPQTVYDGLLGAESKGQYMHAAVLGVYPDYQVSGKRR